MLQWNLARNTNLITQSDREQGEEYMPEENDRSAPLTQADLNDLTQDLNLSKE